MIILFKADRAGQGLRCTSECCGNYEQYSFSGAMCVLWEWLVMGECLAKAGLGKFLLPQSGLELILQALGNFSDRMRLASGLGGLINRGGNSRNQECFGDSVMSSGSQLLSFVQL